MARHRRPIREAADRLDQASILADQHAATQTARAKVLREGPDDVDIVAELRDQRRDRDELALAEDRERVDLVHDEL